MSFAKEFIKGLVLLDGVITYNDFNIDERISFEEQKWSHKEDILQISFGEPLLIDVGYYPEMDPNGCFVVYAIQDYDWVNPLVEIECRSLPELKKTIEETAALLSEKNNGKTC